MKMNDLVKLINDLIKKADVNKTWRKLDRGWFVYENEKYLLMKNLTYDIYNGSKFLGYNYTLSVIKDDMLKDVTYFVVAKFVYPNGNVKYLFTEHEYNKFHEELLAKCDKIKNREVKEWIKKTY